MLRLGDAQIRPRHRGELRVLVAARRTGLGRVRCYLAADLLRRASERSGLLPSVIDFLPDGADELRTLGAELNIHPPQQTLTPPVSGADLAGLFPDGAREPVFDIGVRLAADPAGPAGPADPAGWLAAGPADLAGHWIEVAGAGAEKTGAEKTALGAEPLSVRLMLMRHGYGEPLPDGAEADGEAADCAATLARWRWRVAEWARSPSGSMSRRYAEAITTAFTDDLDTAAALRELAALEDDPDEPDGVKFETFAAADRLLGLDLARDIGRLPQPGVMNCRYRVYLRNESPPGRMTIIYCHAYAIHTMNV
jgi:hypothetical protein